MNILSHGCMGKMSSATAQAINNMPGLQVVVGVDIYPGSKDYPVYQRLEEVKEDFGMIVDFSLPQSVKPLCEYAVKHKKTLVIGTTGLQQEHNEMLREAAQHIPVFASYNMHLGLYYLQEVIRESLKYFKEWDIELVEQHHNKKIDAPSGTAEIIMAMIKEAKPETTFVFDRTVREQARQKHEVGVSCIRSGDIVGIHHLMFGGENEYFELKHTVVDRKALSNGAARVAAWMAGKAAGFYEMKDIIADIKAGKM
ncbi:MAG: 4-hydroxy-tetrahydrodipicolinate reductase [Clostridiales bacterium]